MLLMTYLYGTPEQMMSLSVTVDLRLPVRQVLRLKLLGVWKRTMVGEPRDTIQIMVAPALAPPSIPTQRDLLTRLFGAGAGRSWPLGQRITLQSMKQFPWPRPIDREQARARLMLQQVMMVLLFGLNGKLAFALGNT